MPLSRTLRLILAGLLASALVPVSKAPADEPPGPDLLVTNMEGRRTTSLDGRWKTIVDPFERGYYDYRYQPRRDAFFLDRKARDETDRVEYSFETSPTLLVPGDWNTQRESLLLYEGTVWYRRIFDDPRRDGSSRLLVWFGAVASRAHVFLNGELLGAHEGAFTPFNFEITDRVTPADNVLIVKADNRRRAEAVPTLDFDWWNYGGITRPVRLVEVPRTFVEDYVVQLGRGSTTRIRGWVQLNGPRAEQKVTVRVPEAGVAHTVTTDPGGRAVVDFPAEVELWSPESPRLYDVEIAAETDTVSDRIGFRSLEARGTEILLNGKPVFLRGICAHGEAPYRSGRGRVPAE